MVTLETVALKLFTSLPPALKRRVNPKQTAENSDLPALPVPNPNTNNLLIGPSNSAGQAHLWARAANEVPGWSGCNISYHRPGGFSHRSDFSGSETAVVYSPDWARDLRSLIIQEFDAVIFESLLPLFGSLQYQDAVREIRYLQRRGVKTAVLWHGSDIRRPSIHKRTTTGSVFLDAPPDAAKELENTARRNAEQIAKAHTKAFVSTPDLLRYQPEATWLPLQVDPSFLSTHVEIIDRTVPTVLHLPSRSYLKGTRTIAAQMQVLEAAGVIRYIQPDRVAHAQVRGLLEAADIVIDQLGMDAYGVATLEALALGRTVIGQVGDFVRDAVRSRTGKEIPVQEASGHTLASVVEDVATNFDRRLALSVAGRSYVNDVHSPSSAATALTPFLEGPRSI